MSQDVVVIVQIRQEVLHQLIALIQGGTIEPPPTNEDREAFQLRMLRLHGGDVVFNVIVQTLSVTNNSGIGPFGVEAHIDEVEPAGCASGDKVLEVGETCRAVGDGWGTELDCASMWLHVLLVGSCRLGGCKVCLRACYLGGTRRFTISGLPRRDQITRDLRKDCLRPSLDEDRDDGLPFGIVEIFVNSQCGNEVEGFIEL